MAKRAPARLTVSQLVAEASDFSREAWRSCWLPMLAVTIGHTIQFLDANVASSDWRPGLLRFIAFALMLFYVPLYGGLYRVAVGGRPAAGRGLGGLQWNGVEWRLIAVGVIVAFLAGLAIVPVLALIGILALIPGSRAAMSLGPLGTLSHWAVESIPLWLVFAWLAAPRIARLMLGWAYSTAREKTEPFAGWEPARRSGWPIAWTLALAWVPMLLGYLTVYALTLIEADALSPGAWPLPEAIGAGVLLGALKSAMVAPLLVGALTGAYWLLEEHAAADDDYLPDDAPAPAHHPAQGGSEAAAAAAAATAAAAALAAHEAAELDLPSSEVDHSLTEPAAAAHVEAPAADIEIGAAPDPEARAPEPSGPELSSPQTSGAEQVEAEPALVEAHPAPADVEAAAEHAAAEHAAASHAAEAAATAAAGEAHAATLEPEVPEEVAAEEQPVAAHPAETAPADSVEALSPWPHSILPPWPVREAAPAPAPALTSAPVVPTESGPEGFPPLARRTEPPHRFVEITELK